MTEGDAAKNLAVPRDETADPLSFSVDWEAFIMQEIANPHIKRRDVAQTYHYLLTRTRADKVDWGTINKAIMARWSASALIWIKQQAWSGKCLEGIYGSK